MVPAKPKKKSRASKPPATQPLPATKGTLVSFFSVEASKLGAASRSLTSVIPRTAHTPSSSSSSSLLPPPSPLSRVLFGDNNSCSGGDEENSPPVSAAAAVCSARRESSDNCNMGDDSRSRSSGDSCGSSSTPRGSGSMMDSDMLDVASEAGTAVSDQRPQSCAFTAASPVVVASTGKAGDTAAATYGAVVATALFPPDLELGVPIPEARASAIVVGAAGLAGVEPNSFAAAAGGAFGPPTAMLSSGGNLPCVQPLKPFALFAPFGLPPPAPSKTKGKARASLLPSSSSQQPRTVQQNLDHFTSAAAGAGTSSSQDRNVNRSSQSFRLSQASSQGSNPSDPDSSFCTPQDQQIQERTNADWTEDLHFRRQSEILSRQQHAISAVDPSETDAESSDFSMPQCKKARRKKSSGLTAIDLPEAKQHDQPTFSRSTSRLFASASGKSSPFTQMTDDAAGASSSGDGEVQWIRSCNNPLPLTLVNPFVASLVPAIAQEAQLSPSAYAEMNSKKNKRAASPGASPSLFSAFIPSGFFLTHFEYIRQFGIGSMGIVMLARHRLDGLVYAVKKSKRKLGGPLASQLILREAHILSFLLSRPNCPRSIIRLAFSWQEESHLYMQFEYCEGGCLATILKRATGDHHTLIKMSRIKATESNHVDAKPKPPAADSSLSLLPSFFSTNAMSSVAAAAGAGQAASLSTLSSSSSSSSSPLLQPNSAFPFPARILFQVALQIAQGLAFLHLYGVAHLDVKPENFLQFAEGDYRLADFGLSRYANDLGFIEGDRMYLAPEALEQEITSLYALDCYALGCSLLELGLGRPYEKQHSGMLRFAEIEESLANFPGKFIELVRALMRAEPDRRMTAQECVNTLECIIKEYEEADGGSGVQQPAQHGDGPAARVI